MSCKDGAGVTSNVMRITTTENHWEVGQCWIWIIGDRAV